ncbi:hypothetical protein [Apilactobacillus xinyiensis]|uniref:N-acetyltransferase domain-containing protein n=1 Tax=Apilactobacillus xinyiensis TaxID=2841032 RepID=A0ABT0I0Q4_9LACO|nr:hypothetical protein [Apilactobacillus xinyiensis]MCK8624428.1 hypothetical protein [Apilactobacillus xinyiensis]
MKSFEWLHPILTPHFKLDWLTKFKLKEVNDFQNQNNLQQSMNQSMNYINETMKNVMEMKALVWGVEENESKNLIGIIEVNDLDASTCVKFIGNKISSKSQKAILDRITPLLQQVGCKELAILSK